MTTILIADDEASIRTILSKAMEQKGLKVIRAQNSHQALEYLRTSDIDIALVDIRMPDKSGLEILNHQKEFSSKPLICIMTAQDTMENAIEAMKRGAYDYFTKPFDLDEVSLLVDRALETRNLKKEVQILKQKQIQKQATIIGKSKTIQEIYKTIGKVANQDVTVLIEGESGTGKELVAKAIHFQGNRATYPFVAVNCSAIPPNLLESELFGTKKGAYTDAITDKAGYFERAHLGTLFLDEIGDMPLALQAKLLRVLQEKEIQRLGDTKTLSINVRIIAATNQNLTTQIQKGQFREDLYYRLNVVPIYLPPLRERQSDIPLLVEFFLNKIAQDFQTELKNISKQAMDYLKHKKWTGNIRELENLLKRVFVLSQSPVLEVADFKNFETTLIDTHTLFTKDPKALENMIGQYLTSQFEHSSKDDVTDLYNRLIPLMERPLIQWALLKTKGNQIKAAHLLGINRNTLRKKIRELKIDRRS